MIKKFLQKIFKIISYNFFSIIYKKVKKSIKSSDDERIKVEILNVQKNLKYKIYKISNGRIYTNRIHDTAIMLDDKIIEEPSFQLRYNKNIMLNSKIEDNVVFKIGTPRILKRLNGNVLSLLTGGGGNKNYWHWLFDVLPRLNLCNKIINLKEIDYFLLPNLLNNFQTETLDVLNISKHKRISSEKFRHVKAKNLIVTDHPVVTTGNTNTDIQNIPKWIMLWLKKNFINQNTNSNKKRIYIDRDEDTSNPSFKRMITNEKEVKKCLLDNNFSIIKFHEVDFKRQVELFNNAECVVGLHGGGFANIVFCKPGTKVVELRNSSAGPVIGNLAKKNNLNYKSIIIGKENLTESKSIVTEDIKGQTLSLSIEVNKYDFAHQQGHIEIPISSLSKVLEN